MLRPAFPGVVGAGRRGEDVISGDAFANQDRDMRDVLQAVEDALIDTGCDDFVVATEHGAFHSQIIERTCADAANDNSWSLATQPDSALSLLACVIPRTTRASVD